MVGFMIKYFNIGGLSEKLRPFNFIIGGRGIGKTYSSIDFLINRGERFLYLRNTYVEMEESTGDFGNPFKKWNSNNNRNICIIPERKHRLIKDFTNPDEPKTIGYAAPLSTFENLRGIDLSDVKYILFDEFIEKRTLAFDQFRAFANMYETVNRNRELEGEQPLIVICLSNAQKLDNQILAGYGCIPIIERMIQNNREEYIDSKKLILLPKSEVSEMKANTVSYKAIENTAYYNEALKNKFAFDSFANIVKRNINEYIPICGFDDFFIWKHKSCSKYYICRSSSNNVPIYNTIDSKHIFQRKYQLQLRLAYVSDNIEYSEFLLKSKLQGVIL